MKDGESQLIKQNEQNHSDKKNQQIKIELKA